MKEQIINYFRNDKSYAGGVKLVIRYSLKLGLKKQVNLQAESSYLLGVIHEELREIAGISEQQMKSFIALPAMKPEVKMNIAQQVVEAQDDPEDEEPIHEESQSQDETVKQKGKTGQPVGKPRGRKK